MYGQFFLFSLVSRSSFDAFILTTSDQFGELLHVVCMHMFHNRNPAKNRRVSIPLNLEGNRSSAGSVKSVVTAYRANSLLACSLYLSNFLAHNVVSLHNPLQKLYLVLKW